MHYVNTFMLAMMPRHVRTPDHRAPRRRREENSCIKKQSVISVVF